MVIIEVIARPISLFTYTDEDIIIVIISSEIILFITYVYVYVQYILRTNM